MQRVTLKQPQVYFFLTNRLRFLLIYLTDDVRDIYRRAEGEELVVEGLREGTNLVGEE